MVKDAIAHAIRSRVAGPGGRERAGEIFDTEGPRWFGRDRPIRAVHGDSSMFVGGMRAILLQSLHPLAMAGVAQHSDYQRDPWGRLQRTADFLARTTYGTVDQAEAACRRVRAVHEHVVGVAPRRPPLRRQRPAPHALGAPRRGRQLPGRLPTLWRAGGSSRAGRDGYVADMAVVARALGVPDPPTSVAAPTGRAGRLPP